MREILNAGKINQLVCNQYVGLAYKLGGETTAPFQGNVGTLLNWFENPQDGGESTYLTGKNLTMQNLQKGDALFMQYPGSNRPSHVELIMDILVKDNTVIGFWTEAAKSSVSGVGKRKKMVHSLSDYSKMMGRPTILGIGQMKDKN